MLPEFARDWPAWYRDMAGHHLHLARFCRRHRGEVSALVPGLIDDLIRQHYRVAIAYARHAREYRRTGQPYRPGCVL